MFVPRATVALLMVVGSQGAVRAQDVAGQEPAADQARLPTSEELYYRLKSAIGELGSVRVLMADRSVSHGQPGATPEVLIRRHELFLDGDNAQLRTEWTKEDSTDWWEGPKQSVEPLTQATVSDAVGNVYCFRPEGEVTHSEFTKVNSAKNAPYPSIYAAYRSPRPLGNFTVPFLRLDRAWNHPVTRELAAPLLADKLLLTDYARWEVLGREEGPTGRAVKVRVTISPEPFVRPLSRRSGALSMSTVWTVWFADDEHGFPRRIESDTRYVYDGRDIPRVHTGEGRVGPIYESEAPVRFENGAWYPPSGRETIYLSAPDADSPDLTPDDIVDEFLKTGRHVVQTVRYEALRREWRVVEMTPLPASADLWIEPPEGALLHDVDAGTEIIVGKTAEESQKILGGQSAAGAVPSPATSGRAVRAVLLVATAAVILVLIGWLVWRGKRKNVKT